MRKQESPTQLKTALRNGREIAGKLDKNKRNLQFFLGLYNAVPFSLNVRQTVSQLSEAGFQTLLVDNASSDATWDLVESLVSEHSGFVLGARNPFNVGATASFLLNADLYQSPWVGFLCQDDVYYSSHGPFLEQLVSDSDAGVVGVASAMDRLKFGGRATFYPRLGDMKVPQRAADQAAALVRNHFFPMPAAALRVRYLEGISVSYHDTSFPDTELLLQILKHGVLVVSPERTMAYMENPASESHVINQNHRVRGQALGLIRFFGSPAFEGFLMRLEGKDVEKFVHHLLESVGIRLGESLEADMTQHFLSERVAHLTQYSSSEANTWLQTHYKRIDSAFSNSFFDREPWQEKKVPSPSKELASGLNGSTIIARTKIYNRFMARLSRIILQAMSRFKWQNLNLIFRRK